MLPILAVTSGDPAGSGPEITVKTLSHREIYDLCRPLVIGDCCVLENALKTTGLTGTLRIRKVTDPAEAAYEYGVIDVLDAGKIELEKLEIGKISAYAGEAAFTYVVTAIDLAMKGKVDGTITNAISKEAINLAGHHYSGHTEIYADYTGTKKYCMMLALNDFRVTHVSTHISLAEACRRVKKDRVLEVIELSDDACRRLGIAHPKVAVAGLNPHCGEHGMFGTEEIEEITPAIEAARAKGMSKGKAMLWHGLKNAILPSLTLIATNFGGMISGSFAVETIFTWNGVAGYAIQSVKAKDFPVIQCYLMIIALTYILVNLAIDIVYMYIDPKIRIQDGRKLWFKRSRPKAAQST